MCNTKCILLISSFFLFFLVLITLIINCEQISPVIESSTNINPTDENTNDISNQMTSNTNDPVMGKAMSSNFHSLTENIVENPSIIIYEISPQYSYLNPFWLELYNPTSSSVNLSQYKLRTSSIRIINHRDVTSANQNSVFPLPNYLLQSGSRVIIRNDNIAETIEQKERYDFIYPILTNLNGSVSLPNFEEIEGADPFVELLDSSNQTIHFIKIGKGLIDSTTILLDTVNFPVSNIFEEDKRHYSRVLMRSNDENNPWSISYYPTPGENNIHLNALIDTDLDGFPDVFELMSNFYDGLSLYELGARTNQRDIFVYINYMDSERVIDTNDLYQSQLFFRKKNIHLHLDIGDLYHQSSGISSSHYDLSDTDHLVTSHGFTTSFVDSFFMIKGIPPRANFDLYNFKREHLSINRRNFFHYLLYATNAGVSLAEEPGNDIMIDSILNSDDPLTTFLHELGHNLGLQHGGYEELNFKRNYLSIMNYQYSGGIPISNLFPAGTIVGSPNQLIHGQNKAIDYSDGTSISLNEISLNEANGIGRNLGAFDWNGNGMIDSTNIRFDLNNDGQYSTHYDYNDWDNLLLDFNNTNEVRGSGIEFND